MTSDIAQGTVLAAQVLAQQAASAGIKVHLRELTATEFFGPNYLKVDLCSGLLVLLRLSVPGHPGHLAQGLLQRVPLQRPKYTSLYYQCCAITDSGQAVGLEHEMQEIDYTTNGYIIPYFPPVIGGYAKNLQGVMGSRNGSSFNNCDFKQIWIDLDARRAGSFVGTLSGVGLCLNKENGKWRAGSRRRRSRSS